MASRTCEWLVFQNLNITKVFNNREQALGIWLLILMIYLLAYKKTRSIICNLIKTAFGWKLTIVYVCMTIYVSLIVYILYRIEFWEVSSLKDTIIWFLFSGVVSAFQAIERAENIAYFRKVVLDNFKIVILFQFIVNFYTFSLIGELMLLPIIVVITVFITILDKSAEFQNEKSKPAKKLLELINILIGLYIVIYSAVLAVQDIKNLGTIDTFKSVLLPIILSTAFIVFVFIFAFWSGYEQILIRIKFGEKKSRWLIAYIKIKIFLLCHFNLNRVKNFWRKSGFKIMNVTRKSDVLEIIIEYKKQEKSVDIMNVRE
jgi:hypothetical protein